MRAMMITRPCDLASESEPLELREIRAPVPKPGEILVRVSVCGVCHTEIDEIEGRTPPSRLPMTPGHQVVGVVEESGEGAGRFTAGDRVGIAWIHSACGICKFCRAGLENLCADFEATGRDADGGYAEWLTVREDFAHPIPTGFSDVEAAPLLCAGAIGYRSLTLAGMRDGCNLGLTGFGASGHLVLQLARYQYPDSHIFVFARSAQERAFARTLGAEWTGDTGETSPERLDCIIDTTPAWKPVVAALGNLDAGGRLVINAIRKENLDKDQLLSLDYSRHVWLEKEIKSVANVTRSDVDEFLAVAAKIPIRPEVQEYRLEQANGALVDLKHGRIRGAKVLKVRE